MTATKKAIGAVTIGQAPRDDLVPQLEDALGKSFTIIQVGALDGLSKEEIESQFEKSSGALLVTRLRGGAEVRLKESLVTPRLRDCVQSLQDRVDLILFLCTGDFPDMASSRPILFPGPLLQNVVSSLSANRVGVLTPAAEQIEPQRARWDRLVRSVVLDHASPYGSPMDLEAAAERLGGAGVDVVAMDCIGYTREMKQLVSARIGRPVITASSLLARVATELLETQLGTRYRVAYWG
jgi:protein AroM